MAENLAPAACTEQEYEAARAAGLLVVTTGEERAIHAFAEAIRAEQRATSARLFDALETLTEAITTGAGRNFIEAFVRDASAALEEAQPGWNKLDEPTSNDLRAKGRLRAAAPELLAELQRTADFLRSACIVITDKTGRGMALEQVRAACTAIAKATGSAS